MDKNAGGKWTKVAIGSLLMLAPLMSGALCGEDLLSRSMRLGGAISDMDEGAVARQEVGWNTKRNEVMFVATKRSTSKHGGARFTVFGGQMYAVSLETGQVRLVNDPPGDGRKVGKYGIAYDRSFDVCRGGTEVMFSTLRFSDNSGSFTTARLAGDEKEGMVIAKRGTKEVHPRCQPEGTLIAALVNDREWRGGEEPELGYGLYMMDYEGKDSRRVDGAGRVWPIAPRWSPDGKLLAVVDVEGRVSVFEVESGRVWKGGRLGLEGDFAWAPCSCRLAYVGWHQGASQSLEVLELKEERAEVLLTGYFGALTWVQDGTALIFGSHNVYAASGRMVGPGLVRLDLASGEMERLNDWGNDVLGLAWDREGSWLAVRLTPVDGGTKEYHGVMLYIVRADGTELRVLVRQGSEGQPIAEPVDTADGESDAAWAQWGSK